jgi:ribose transport system permease protein
MGTEITGIVITLFIECLIFALVSPNFLRPNNIFAVLRMISITGIVAVGMTMVLIAGYFDLSVGSTLGLSGILAGYLIVKVGVPLPLAIAASLSTGALIGLGIGLLVTRLQINAFIVTLGFLSVARGLVYVISPGANINVRSPVILFLGQGQIGHIIPIQVVIMILLVIIGEFFMRRTVTGRYIYATGGNSWAAKLTGIKINRITILVFIITGLLAAFAGIVYIGKLGTAEVIAGSGLELEIIAAVIIGGTSLKGGKGSVVGSLIGAAIVGVLKNGFVLIGMPIAGQTIGTGVIIILAVTIDSIRSGKRSIG